MACNDNRVVVLVNSCDKYSEAWEPFLTLLYKQWPDCCYPVVIVTEEKIYDGKFPNVKTFRAGKKSWGARLKAALESLDTEIVLYFLEDFFLLTPVDNSSFVTALEEIDINKDIGYIGLKYNEQYSFKDENSIDKTTRFFNKDELTTMHRVNNMTALWRRRWLIELIRTYETPWEFDNYASVRSKRYNYRVLQINNLVCAPVFNYGVDLKYGYGISGGKWLKKNIELFAKNGIAVDFERMGFLEVDENGCRVVTGAPNGVNSGSIIKIIGSKLKKSIRKIISTHF